MGDRVEFKGDGRKQPMTKFGGRKDIIREVTNQEDRLRKIESSLMSIERAVKNLATVLSEFERELGYSSTLKKNDDRTMQIIFRKIPTWTRIKTRWKTRKDRRVIERFRKTAGQTTVAREEIEKNEKMTGGSV